MKKKPGRPRTAPAEVFSTEESQLRCPKGHRLPHRTNQGTCTPVHCAGSASGKGNRRPRVVENGYKGKFTEIGRMGGVAKKSRSLALQAISTEADAVIDTMIPETVPGYKEARAAAKMQKGEEIVRLANGIGRWAAMRAFFKVPEGLVGEKAEEWVQQRSMMLSVDALAELERQLKLGDDTQRREAARDILDMTGQRKKAEAAQATPVFILQNVPGQTLPPWAQRVVEGDTKKKELEAGSAQVNSR
jgi:hypothetical protein